ncbi:MAG: septum formation protein Maf [Lachnospiraceae bacterium]|nr:septum formation protein Maf [Lachnospiraceae bacterium]
MKIILASSSPRRKEIMELAGLSFEIDTSDADESMEATSGPSEYVEELSLRKASAVAGRHPDDIVIGADTIVSYNGIILGKPKDSDDAFRMLKMLSGKTHSVYTGVTIAYPVRISGRKPETFHVRTDVVMYDNPDALLKAYAGCGEPLDKAGAYAIQGRGCILVERIDGDYYNVMGLPIAELCRRLGSEAQTGL